mmetsp:Transcript_12387/g.18578  ORF Transcript_12387/g.18578 Transcript_12387/m.18578 type:complete len:262 (+) Transcript_12387:59-844(+)
MAFKLKATNLSQSIYKHSNGELKVGRYSTEKSSIFTKLFSYFGNRPEDDILVRNLWENITFEVGPGEVLVISGPSGIGKTLLLKSVASLDPLVSGRVQLIDQKNQSYSWEDIGTSNWRARVAFVLQTPPNFSLTASEYFKSIQLFSSNRDRKLSDPKQIAGKWGILPEKFDQSWADLSGGEKQRIYLSIVLSLKPDILLLDEPTSALDSKSVLLVEETIKESRIPTIWVTHSKEQEERVATKYLKINSEEKYYSIEGPDSL